MERRTVITGIGVLSPIGIGHEQLWEGLSASRCGIKKIQSFDVDGFAIKIAAEVSDFDARKFVKQRKALKVMARDIQLAVAAAGMAMEDGGLTDGGVDPTRLGVSLGAGFMSSELDELGVAIAAARNEEGRFDIRKFGSEGMSMLFPLWLLKYLPNMLACHVSIIHNAQGPNNTITTACAASSQAIGEAFRVIERGSADAMMCGGSESKINPISLVRYTLLDILSKRNEEPEKAARPFDADRDGFVLGEGAGIIILEELEHARARGAKICGELIGYGSSCDPDVADRGTPQASARVTAMTLALSDAGISPEEVDVICAHGMGAVENDRAEAEAIKEVFGKCTPPVPVTSIKSMIGHLCAGAGAVELISCILAMNNGVIPPILNCDHPEPDLGLDLVRGAPRQAEIRTVLANACSFAGQNACLVLKKLED